MKNKGRFLPLNEAWHPALDQLCLSLLYFGVVMDGKNCTGCGNWIADHVYRLLNLGGKMKFRDELGLYEEICEIVCPLLCEYKYGITNSEEALEIFIGLLPPPEGGADCMKHNALNLFTNRIAASVTRRIARQCMTCGTKLVNNLCPQEFCPNHNN